MSASAQPGSVLFGASGKVARAVSFGLCLAASLTATSGRAQDADDRDFNAPATVKPALPPKASETTKKVSRPAQQDVDLNDVDLIAPEPPRKPRKLAKPAISTKAPPASSDSSMDFDLLPEKKGSAEGTAAITSKVNTRRTMLQLHTGFGIATTALMVGTVVTGQLDYSDKFNGGNTGQFELLHSVFEAATVISFATAGMLAVLAPVPFEKKSTGVDTITVHKWSMIAATAGIAAEIPLGIYTVAREGYVNQATFAVIHLALGYFTAAALGTGVTALFF